jgi:DNA-binding SARP family transcriptional activator
MKIKVLGPLVVSNGVNQAVPTARKPRKVFSLLLLNNSQVVPVSSLLTELWDDAPPKTALTTLQTYVLTLRKLLATAFGISQAEVARDVLQTRSNGYSFAAQPGDLDLHDYRRLEGAGECALQIGDDAEAVRLFRQALGIWRGSVLLDVEHGRLLQAEAARLEQSRLTMLERRIEAELRLGRHRDTLSDLASLVVQHPFHEDLHAQFMLALYRSGRRTRALEVFHQLRTSLIDELGLEPSVKLQRLQQAVLASSPDLDADVEHSPSLPAQRLSLSRH